MEMILERFSSGPDSTVGVLYVPSGFRFFTCEDEFRENKVAGKTRIPAGHYKIRVRTHGGFHARYGGRYPWHRGMLELEDVPGFSDILIHIGNNHIDTRGCLLVGYGAVIAEGGGGEITRSTPAYEALYKSVIDDAEAGKLSIHVIDRDQSEAEQWKS